MYRIGLLVYDYSLYGGAEKVAIKQANEFVKNYEVHFISCFAEDTKPIMALDEKVKCHVLEKKVKSMTLNVIGISSKLRKYLKKNKIDVLLSITAGVNTIAIFATWCTNTKLIYVEHSNLLNKTFGKKHQLRQWLGVKFADYIVTLTEADKNVFIDKFHINNKCGNIYNWYDGKVMSEAYAHDSKKIITVGRLVSVKGYDRLMCVAKEVLREYPEWYWDIYGSGPLHEELSRIINDNNLQERIILKGNCPNVIDVYKQYAFFVMTSYYEGLPLVLLEAKSNRLPVISFDCPTGPSEMITDGYDGFLVQNGNIDLMIEKVKQLIVDEELRTQFSKNSTTVLTEFGKEKIVEKWVRLIDRFCEKK